MKISVDDKPIGEVKRMNLDPGDAILVELNFTPTMLQAERVRDQVRRVFPDHDVLVVPASAKVSIVANPLTD